MQNNTNTKDILSPEQRLAKNMSMYFANHTLRYTSYFMNLSLMDKNVNVVPIDNTVFMIGDLPVWLEDGSFFWCKVLLEISLNALLTLEEAATEANVDVRTIQRWVKRGLLCIKNDKGKPFFPSFALRKFAQKMGHNRIEDMDF